jgi:hypothetical protein
MLRYDLCCAMMHALLCTDNVCTCTYPRPVDGGSVRRVVETGWVSLLMNYTGMRAGGEATTVLVKLLESTHAIWGGHMDSLSILLSWGELSCARFKTRYTRGLGWRMHCGVVVTESSTNKQHHLSLTIFSSLLACSIILI